MCAARALVAARGVVKVMRAEDSLDPVVPEAGVGELWDWLDPSGGGASAAARPVVAPKTVAVSAARIANRSDRFGTAFGMGLLPTPAELAVGFGQ
jgi:hypothetical protein